MSADKNEILEVDRLTIPRFATLDELVMLFTNDRSSTNHTLLGMTLMCLPQFSSELELFRLLEKRFKTAGASSSGSGGEGGVQACNLAPAGLPVRIKVMLVLRSWLKLLSTGPVPLDDTYDSKVSLVEALSDFLENGVDRKEAPVMHIVKSLMPQVQVFKRNVESAKTMWESYQCLQRGEAKGGSGNVGSSSAGATPPPAPTSILTAIGVDNDPDADCDAADDVSLQEFPMSDSRTMSVASSDAATQDFMRDVPTPEPVLAVSGTPPSPIVLGSMYRSLGRGSLGTYLDSNPPSPFGMVSPISASPNLDAADFSRLAHLAFDESPTSGGLPPAPTSWPQTAPIHDENKDDITGRDAPDEITGTVPRVLRVPTDVREISIAGLFSPQALADALTVLDWALWMSSVRPHELLHLAWTQPTLKVRHPDIGGSWGSQRLIQSTNHTVAWVASEVVKVALQRDMAAAASMITYFISTARQAFKINNFNAVFLVVSALGLPSVKTLKPAWSMLRPSVKKLFHALKGLCGPSNNYAAYRKVLQEIGEDPYVPVFQVAIRDVTFVQGAGPWTVADENTSDVRSKEEDRIDLRKVVSVYERIEILLKRREREPVRVVTESEADEMDAAGAMPDPNTPAGQSLPTCTSSQTGKSYRIFMELSEEQCDWGLGQKDPTALFSALNGMGKVVEQDRLSPPEERQSDDELLGWSNGSEAKSDAVLSFLSLQEHCVQDIFSLMAEEMGEPPIAGMTPSSSAGDIYGRASSSSGRGSIGSNGRSCGMHRFVPTPTSSSTTTRRLFEADGSPMRSSGGGGSKLTGRDDGTITPGSADVGVRSSSLGTRSSSLSARSMRGQPKKDWSSQARFTIHCSELQISYLLSVIIDTRIAFSALQRKAKAACTLATERSDGKKAMPVNT